MTKIQELKLTLKTSADEIRAKTAELKAAQHSGCTGATLMQELATDSYYARHYHIAYCELRGRTRDQIERPRKDHPADEALILKVKAQYAWEVPA